MPVVDCGALIDERIKAVRTFHDQAGMPRAQVDLSGGIDSAVMTAILVRAFGAHNVTAVYTGIHSSEESLDRAREVAERFKFKLNELDLSTIYDSIQTKCINSLGLIQEPETPIYGRRRHDPTIDGSLKSCLRAPIGRYMNRLSGNGIRHGTGNECEDRWLRFYQKGGDGEVDTNPLGFLSKGEVSQIALELEVPQSVIEAHPTPDLTGQTDEEELANLYNFPWTYSRIDENGNYSDVGTIEFMSRALDLEYTGTDVMGRGQLDEALFLRRPIGEAMIEWFTGVMLNHIDMFNSMSNGKTYHELAAKMLQSCKNIERATRHKVNPNIPYLGTRIGLIDQGILTNKLPSTR